jgi:hypothetical protein
VLNIERVSFSMYKRGHHTFMRLHLMNSLRVGCVGCPLEQPSNGEIATLAAHKGVWVKICLARCPTVPPYACQIPSLTARTM